MPKSVSKVATIMMADIVDYSLISSRLRRDDFENLNERFEGIAIPVFEKYHGWVVKKIGDCFLVVFESATDAVLCGIELQKRFRRYNLYNQRVPIRIRVALNSGDILIKDKDIYGEPVNTLERIKGETKPGHVVFSGSVYLAMNKGEIPHVFIGKKLMKGLKRPVPLFRVKWPEEDAIRKRQELIAGITSIIKWFITFAVIFGIGWCLYKYVGIEKITAWLNTLFENLFG